MSNQNIEGFCRYIADRWDRDFTHSYRITRHHAWNHWRKNYEPSTKNQWYCNSISQADAHYSWTGTHAAAEFVNLSSELQSAVDKKDEAAAHESCVEILKWGGVWKGGKTASVDWLKRAYEKRILCARLREAHNLLVNIDRDLEAFDGSQLLMNSSMTKIYAALDPSRLVIYDGRVGAALGLLAKDYLRSINYRGAVPGELRFHWGASRGAQVRNPSDEEFCFPALFGYRKDKLHAEMMRHTSNILRRVTTMIAPPSSCNPARLERALFMIGYDTSRS